MQFFENGCMWFNRVDESLCTGGQCAWDTSPCWSPTRTLGIVHIHLEDEDAGPRVDWAATRSRLDDVELEAEPNPGLSPPQPDCSASDRCVDGACAASGTPNSDTTYLTPATGAAVYLASENYTAPFITQGCYELLYDDFEDVVCLADDSADELDPRPSPCTNGFHLRQEGESAVYEQHGDDLRPLCGAWSEYDFQVHAGRSFDTIVTTDAEHFDRYTDRYPVSGPGIYPPGSRAPECGDPGYECGVHTDGEGGRCFDTLDCGACPTCGDNTCNGDEDCASCPGDCGPCRSIVAGAITTPAGTVPNTGFDVAWTQGEGIGYSVSTTLYCRENGGEWEREVGYGATSPRRIHSPPPGGTVTCKTRTRNNADHAQFEDSELVTWTVSSDYAAMQVVSVQLDTTDPANGCDLLRLQATIRNNGDQYGNWGVHGWLHPAGSSVNSSAAIADRYSDPARLDPGESGTVNLVFDRARLPLSTGDWEFTVEVRDDFNNNAGTPSRRTIAAVTSDVGPPVIEYLDILGRNTTPTQILPGRTHQVRFAVEDDYAVDSLALEWRTNGGAWQPMASTTNADDCAENDALRHDWLVPESLPAGRTIEIRGTATDAAGNEVSDIITAVTLSNEEPAVGFIAPLGGEVFEHDTNDDPSCVPFEVYITPGVPLDDVEVGLSTTAPHGGRDTQVHADGFTGGLLNGCLDARNAGDQITVFVHIEDDNRQEFEFQSEPFTIELPKANAPWKPIVVEQSQGESEAPSTSTFNQTAYANPVPVGNNLAIYRRDSGRWDEGRDDIEWLAIRDIILNPTTFGLVTELDILPPYSEVYDHPDDGSIRLMLWPNRHNPNPLRTWHEVDPTACPDPNSAQCDYTFYAREVIGGVPTEDKVLATYTALEWSEAPLLATSVLSPMGARMIMAKVGRNPTSTEIFRDAGAGYQRIFQSPQSFRELEVANGQLYLFSYDRPSSGSVSFVSRTLNEQTGGVGPAMTADTGSDGSFLAWSEVDLVTGELHVLTWKSDQRTLSLFRQSGPGWQQAGSLTLPEQWRAKEVPNVYPQGLFVSNRIAWTELQITADGTRYHVMVPVGDTVNTQFDDSFVLSTRFNSAQTTGPSGDLISVFASCQWNFESRLCLQGSHAGVMTDCYSTDPCTPAEWDAENGVCIQSSVTCPSDGNECNGPEFCSPESGECVSDDTQAIICDDQSYCNGAESCSPDDGSCISGTPPVVDDGLLCTVDACDDLLAEVTHTPDDQRCFVDACHVAECAPDDVSADATTGCIAVPLPPADDGLTCTVDVCDPQSGETVHTPDANSCAIDGACYAAGDANPNNPCETCDPSLSATTWSDAPVGTTCNDGLICTINDECTAGVCGGEQQVCGDTGTGCSTSVCSESVGGCIVQNEADGTSCADFDQCNGEEQCMGGLCRAGTPPDLTSDNACVELTCDPLGGIQTHEVPPPSDGLECTIDACDPVDGVTHTVDAFSCLIGGQCYAEGDANPTNPCEVCDPTTASDTWSARPPGASCDNGSFCDGEDTCQEGVCTPAGSPCGDGLDCTTDACDEEADACVNVVNDGFCVEDGECVANDGDDCEPDTEADTAPDLDTDADTDVDSESDGGGCGGCHTGGSSGGALLVLAALLGISRRRADSAERRRSARAN